MIRPHVAMTCGVTLEKLFRQPNVIDPHVLTEQSESNLSGFSGGAR